ncbi:RagB/SusD family nutrient uptake outer membrane protein [Persicobacter psychrovividus]|uniref:Outer membrane protein n=1 Tax=Persicobacter psychrovividus TaxID=387638 RepID=A0ABN6L687_9BACT|nr:outer membrane protein [Persicobacter psychrovividus]
MTINNIKNLALAFFVMLGLSGCLSDLDVVPIDPNLDTADKVYQTQNDLEGGLAKIYAGFSVSGQQGPAGNGDLKGFDEGNSQYLRGYWVCQELPTDEAINGWNDGNLPKMSQITWGGGNEFIRSFYYRAIYQVSLANEFIRQAKRFEGQDGFDRVPELIAEARYLRAFAYWHALDLFGNGVPFVTENDPVGAFLPPPAGAIKGDELFNFISSEIKAILGENPDDNNYLISGSGTTIFGRANQGAARMLLAKLYLNHKSYLSSEDNQWYTAAKEELDKIYATNAYSLVTTKDAGSPYSVYETLFLADNQKAASEIIWAFTFDGQNAKSFGGTTYIINAGIGGQMVSTDYGTSGSWGGNRTTPEFVNLFDQKSPTDGRDLFFTQGQSKEINQQDQFTQGYAVTKFKNKKQDGTDGSNLSEGFADVNFPVFRLADAYLMSAELDLRLNNTVTAENLARINQIRTRGGAPAVTNAVVDLDWMIEERGRELYWEGHRRTDLIRFNQFTGGAYVWAFKGGNSSGRPVEDYFAVMPIPSTDVNANPNLTQNPGY